MVTNILFSEMVEHLLKIQFQSSTLKLFVSIESVACKAHTHQ
jgi:hypothetical protein